MRIWLDDERDPKLKYIQQRYGADPTLFWVKTASECIALVESGLVEFIDFDHDLGIHNRTPPNTGYDVAKRIEELAFKGKIKQIQCRVHSDNPVGSRDIKLAMRNANTYWNTHKAKAEYGGEQ